MKLQFYGRQFESDRRTCLIRPYTEVYVQQIILDWRGRCVRAVDIGCGAGAIIITLALELQGEFIGLDLDPRALELATENADQLGARVTFRQSDLLCKVEGAFDVVFANLPYELRGDDPDTDELGEPAIAVFDSTGVKFGLIARFLGQVQSRMSNNSLVYLEIPPGELSLQLFYGVPIALVSGEVVGVRLDLGDVTRTLQRLQSNCYDE